LNTVTGETVSDKAGNAVVYILYTKNKYYVQCDEQKLGIILVSDSMIQGHLNSAVLFLFILGYSDKLQQHKSSAVTVSVVSSLHIIETRHTQYTLEVHRL